MTATTEVLRVAFERSRRLGVPLLTIAVVLLPFADPTDYVLRVAVVVFVYVALGLGLNIVVGLAGLLDLGYIGFYALGAYTYALATTIYGVPFVPALLAGGLVAMATGIVLGWPAIRTRGDYLALVTLGLGETIRLVARNWDSVTNGPQGIMNVPPPSVFGSPVTNATGYYYVGLIIAGGSLFVFVRIKASAVGRQLRAIRDDEDAASSIGISHVRWKLYAFATGALIAGVAGAFFASWQRFVSPESFSLLESILVLAIVVLGGFGRLWGCIAAAVFLVILPELLRDFQAYRILVLGVLLVLTVVVQSRTGASTFKQRGTTSIGTSVSTAGAPLTPRSSDRVRSETTVLDVKALGKSFGGVEALRGVSFQLRRGEVLGLLGANGAGKSTLLGCIAGAISLDDGSVSLLSRSRDRAVSIARVKEHLVARLGLVRTFQQPRLFASMTPLENVMLGARCRRVPSWYEPVLLSDEARDRRDAEGWLSAVGVSDQSVPAGDMTFVDQKLIELGRALATRPSILLLDEPASGMEPAARERLTQLIRWFNREHGISVVIVEHDVALLRDLCDRFIVLDQGRVAVDAAPNSESVSQILRRAYEGVGADNATA